MSEPMDPREQFGEHGEWDALAVGWALSALDPEDEERFAAHLPGCARCTATVRESLYTVADLAYALPDEAPPPSLRSRLMAAVAAEPRTPGPVVAVDPRAGDQEPAAEPVPGQAWPLGAPHPGVPAHAGPGERRIHPQPAAAGARDEAARDQAAPDERVRDDGARDEGGRGDVVPVASRQRLTRWASVGAAVAAVLALVAGLLVSNARLRTQQDDLRRTVAQRDALIQQLTANGPARVAALTDGGRPSPIRRATLVVRGDQVEIITEALRATTGDGAYWLWTLRCDTQPPTDLKPIHWFRVAQPEFSVRTIGSEPGVVGAQCFAISSEPSTATPRVPRHVVAVGQPE